jgi:hypothetical protein
MKIPDGGSFSLREQAFKQYSVNSTLVVDPDTWGLRFGEN